MARQSNRLSALAVGRLKEPAYYADGGNLYFRIATGGARGWIFRFALNGRKRDAGLGAYPTISLAEARKQAASFREMVARGIDPIEQRDAERMASRVPVPKTLTFDDCKAAYIAAHEGAWRNAKHRQQWRNSLATYATPVLGRLPVDVIDTSLVLKVLQPIWTTKPETANRLRGRIETILDWAKVSGYRSGENPARWRGHLAQLLPPTSKIHRVKHFAALPFAEIVQFMVALGEQDGISAHALEFLILTATRTNETINATWSEIDRHSGVWTIPGERMKADREHRVPLSDAALKLVSRMHELRISDYVFPGHRQGRPLSEMALLMLLRRMGRGDITAHGFRSSFRDWAAERTNFQREVVEMALAHSISDAVEAAYRRGDLFEKRRGLMTAWSDYCGTVSASADVIPIAARA